MAKYDQLAASILEAVGGKENVVTVSHCMTRLRFILHDESKASDDVLKAIVGVITVVRAGGQVQVVIGTTVDKVYDEICKLGNFAVQAPVDENPDGGKKLDAKTILNNVMGYISGSITPALPAFIAAGIFKMIAVLFGPKNLGILDPSSDLYVICDLISTVGYYYLPMYIAYSASKRLNCSPVLSLMVSGLLIHPTMLEIVSSGEPFTVFGIPMIPVNYTQAVFPILIIVWALSYVEKLAKKYVPDAIRTLGVPVVTVGIMAPLSLCVLGPICSVLMGWIADGLLWMTNTIGVPTMVVMGAVWPFVVMFGMHVPIMTALLPSWLEMGFDAIVSPATLAQSLAGFGCAIAYALRASTKENRTFGWSCAVPMVTNISEPFLYGVMLRDRRALAYSLIGGAAGAAVMGILGAKVTIFSGVGLIFLGFLRFGEYAIPGAIGMIVAFSVSFVLGILFGFEGSGKLQKKSGKEVAKV